MFKLFILKENMFVLDNRPNTMLSALETVPLSIYFPFLARWKNSYTCTYVSREIGLKYTIIFNKVRRYIFCTPLPSSLDSWVRIFRRLFSKRFTFGSKSGTKSLVRWHQAKFTINVPEHWRSVIVWLIHFFLKIMLVIFLFT